MRKIGTQRQNCNHKYRYSQHYPRLITGSRIADDPANAHAPIALRGLRIAQNYPLQHIPEVSDADY
jgi:hypothetical protein